MVFTPRVEIRGGGVENMISNIKTQIKNIFVTKKAITCIAYKKNFVQYCTIRVLYCTVHLHPFTTVTEFKLSTTGKSRRDFAKFCFFGFLLCKFSPISIERSSI